MKTKKTTIISAKDIKKLQERVEKLEGKVLAPVKKYTSLHDHVVLMSRFYGIDSEESREISLEEKINLIAKHLGITFDMKPKEEETPIIKVIKVPKKKAVK